MIPKDEGSDLHIIIQVSSLIPFIVSKLLASDKF